MHFKQKYTFEKNLPCLIVQHCSTGERFCRITKFLEVWKKVPSHWAALPLPSPLTLKKILVVAFITIYLTL